MSARARILVVDDDKAVRTALSVNLGKGGHEVALAESGESALEALTAQPWDIVFTDVRMAGMTGLSLLQRVRERWPEVFVVVMTGQGSIPDAVAAMKAGALDYLIKPVGKDELLLLVERALEHKALRAELVQLRKEVQRQYGFQNLIGTTPAMLRLYEEIAAVAETSATVLLVGPTGTGKELLAHALHYRSPRATRPFVRVNCAAIPDTLLESELFGHEKGAFTGAVRQHLGRFEQADGGTILLDEIGEIGPSMQVKLLRVLQNGELQRVGSSHTTRVDVRVIAATNKDLRAEADAGRFREDLYYRLNVITLKVPPLSDRRADIPLLVDHFARKFAERDGRPLRPVAKRSLERLMAYTWPGNVRQLEHAVERAVILCRDDELDVAVPDEPEKARNTEENPLPPIGDTLQDALLAFEKRVVIAALKEANGVQARAARRLGLSRSNFAYRVQKLGLERMVVGFVASDAE